MSLRVALCTDSSAQLPRHLAVALDVLVVPIPITVDGAEQEEDAIDTDWFYEQLAAGARATTSQPSPGAFARAYAALADAGAQLIVSIHSDSRVSGTVQSASLAAADARVPVSVIDSGTASFGVSVCVLEAHRALGDPATADEAAARLARLVPTIENGFVAPDAPGGRVARAIGVQVFAFTGGETRTLGEVDDIADAPAVIAAEVGRRGRVRAAVGHAARAVEGHADELAYRLGGTDSVVSVLRYRVGPSVGVHAGASSFGAFWWPGD